MQQPLLSSPQYQEIELGKCGAYCGYAILAGISFSPQHHTQFQFCNCILHGHPFDRLCRREGKWYIVEIKGGHHGFGGVPSHTQKRRMRQVLEQVQELEPVLLQIDRENAKYKIRYGQEVHDLIADKERKRLQIDNIIGWVKNIISSHE